ncbi:thioredoxin [Mycoplasmopsis canis UF31]|uniref:Thioredoxin n=1 Tax=Mycoplasmopsis canis TaxID=29555 RepID=A0A0F6ZNR0_9BACT|nr:thioredoxin family protein [Mycoplasmopsis canis]AKF41398.1 thioredoxin [Mycoplasmopsis canis]AMD81518.1 thioredoxin [Mycoplasmopsis canis PG 14]EIE39312.1 thioredoxin [Mycoplasmopsis canis UF33]EIE39463.1 thioredoxin [Mycoplasmopsis canis PG 14]EIE39619.1 thioredoxin [Mycoplasmopsis canis UF31]
MLREVNTQEALESIKEGKKLLVFHALWCGPCRMYKSTLEELAEKKGVEILRVNIEENREFANQAGVRSIPYTQLYEDGKMVGDLLGFRTFDDLSHELSDFINK